MKIWIIIELISKVLILLTVGFQFLVIQPINDGFQNDRQEIIKTMISTNKVLLTNLFDKVSELKRENFETKENTEINVTEKQIVLSVEAIKNLKSCATIVIGEERVSDLYSHMQSKLTTSNIDKHIEGYITKLSEEEIDEIINCFLGLYSTQVQDVLKSLGEVIQEIGEPIVEKVIVKPILVKFHTLATWVNFIIFIVGSFLAIYARMLELKPTLRSP